MRRAAHPALFPQCGQQAVDPDGDANGGHGLPGEPRHEVVVAAPACDRSELTRAAFVVENLERQLCLEHRPGVVAKATHDRGVDDDAVRTVTLRFQEHQYLFEFIDSLLSNYRFANQVSEHMECRSISKCIRSFHIRIDPAGEPELRGVGHRNNSMEFGIIRLNFRQKLSL